MNINHLALPLISNNSTSNIKVAFEGISPGTPFFP